MKHTTGMPHLKLCVCACRRSSEARCASSTRTWQTGTTDTGRWQTSRTSWVSTAAGGPWGAVWRDNTVTRRRSASTFSSSIQNSASTITTRSWPEGTIRRRCRPTHTSTCWRTNATSSPARTFLPGSGTRITTGTVRNFLDLKASSAWDNFSQWWEGQIVCVTKQVEWHPFPCHRTCSIHTRRHGWS